MTHETLANSNTQWFCRHHFDCHNPILGADIVQASMSYEHMTRDEYEKIHADNAKAWCHERGLFTVPQMREYIHNNIGKIGKK